jgi:AraC family transcriptional regulator of adaptative response/methylated-DNA-[protein]-cysteine methyltransferase
VAELGRRFPRATLRRAPERLAPVAAELDRRLRGRAPRPLSLLLAGTPFQLQVWEALLRVPAGHVVDYRQVAAAIGAPGAQRAVARAVGENPIAYLIPCHRVIRATGAFGGYRWGETRKRALLAVEHAQARSTRNP